MLLLTIALHSPKGTLMQNSPTQISEPFLDAPRNLMRPSHPAISALGISPAAAPTDEMNSIEIILGEELPGLSEVEISLNRQEGIFWSFYKQNGRPCFTLKLLDEMQLVHRVIRSLHQRQTAHDLSLKWCVLASKVPGVYNYGGDLSLFAHLIRTQNKPELERYAERCVQLVFNNYVTLDLPILTVALLQGDTLGGGFESAMACNFIIAERGCKIGLPEVGFHLFPGMGAYSFLYRRVGSKIAREMIGSGRCYSPEELQELGMVDLVVEPGTGIEATNKFITENKHHHRFFRSRMQAEQFMAPVSPQELMDIVQVWVAEAMQIEESDIKKMERISYLQTRKITRPAASPLTTSLT